MAARVNKQFVIILVSVIVTLMIGVAALAVWMQSKTGETRVAQGDEAMAAGNYEEAERLYGRAVNKDQTRVDWLEKWIDALTKTTPQSELAYRKAYNELYIQALRQLSVNQPTKPQPLLNYIKEIDDRFALTGGQTASGYQSFVTQIDERARRLPEDDPLTKKIRGYRGRALLGLMIATSVDPEVREEALADLRAAAESDPADWESAYAIVRWHYAEAERFVREVRPDLAEPAMEKANAELRTLVDALGDTIPEVAVYELAVELEYRSREAATTEQRRAVIQELRPMAEAVVEQFETTPLEDVRVSALNRAFPTVSYILDRPGAEALLEVARRKLEAEPENPSVMTLAADFAKRTGSLEEAFDIYGRVAELADRPVSLIGYVMPFYRRAAVSERIGILIQKVDNAEEADRDALLAEAQAERDRYAEMVGAAQEGELKLRDAQIAIRRGENSRAIALLAELRRTTATDSPDVLLPLARALAGQGNFGEARRVYSELIDLEPRIAPMLELAQIELQQRNLTTALALYERAYVLAPENEEIAQRINLIKRGQGEQVTPTDLDPIVVAILDAREAVSSGDDARAVTILEAAYEKAPTDMRILRELIPLDISEGGRELAAQRVERSLQVDPNNGRLMALRTQLTETDPLKIQLEIVEQMDADDYTKHLARYNVYLQQDDMNDEALAELDAAEALKPNDKRLVDVRFNRALLEGDIDEARRWQERASDANLDERGGLLYLGRVQLAEGNTAEAESTLKRAVDRIEYDPEGWRWLARAQRLNGKVDAALASYKRAYEGRPDSADIAVEYATLLATSGKGAEALAVIGPETGLLRTGRQPNRVVDLWLGLESQYGNRERAMEVRERTFSNNQGNFDNAYAYVLMLLEDERYADADAAITEMETRPGVGQLRVAELRALSLAEQEQVAEGRAVLTGFIDNTPEADRTVDPFIALGLFEQRHGDVQDAIAAFEAGRPYQDPETAVADRALGDLLARLGEVSRRQVPASRDEDPEAYDRLSAEADAYFERAVEVFERAQASMSTPDPALSKQIARVLARLDRQSDAIAILNDLENPEDKEALMMKADFAVSNGNVREARTILNRVVELYPNDPQGFFMRARVNAVETVDGQTQINETMLPDVMADLDQAVSLNPEFLQAWELRFQIYQSLGEFDRAFNQLTEAIEASPDNHELRWLLVNRLQAFGELDRAQAQAVIGARANPESERWLERAGFLSFITRRYRESAELYQQLYDLTENPGKASDVLNALLRRDPEPTRAEVNRLLQIVRDVKDADAPTMMLWARAHDFLGNTSNAEQLTQQAYEKAKVSSAQARIWFDALVQRLDDDPDKAFVYLEDFARKLENRGEQLPVYIRLLETQNNFQKTADASAALAALDSMQPEIEDDGWAMLQLYRIQNQVYYALGRFEDVADACRAGLKLFPRDLEFNNNLAYTLAKHLDEPELARQYAERAAELAPLNSAVLDTLGWVRYEAAIKSDGLERDQGLRDSVAILERAIRTSSNVNERVPPLIHMGNAQLALGEMEEANRYRDLARDAIRQAREGIQQEYQAEFEALTNAIAGGRR